MREEESYEIDKILLEGSDEELTDLATRYSGRLSFSYDTHGKGWLTYRLDDEISSLYGVPAEPRCAKKFGWVHHF